MTTKINVGLLGAGRIGRVHAENLATRIPAANVAVVGTVLLAIAIRESATKVLSPYFEVE